MGCRQLSGIGAFAARRFAAFIGINRGYTALGLGHASKATTKQKRSDKRSCDHPQSPANIEGSRDTTRKLRRCHDREKESRRLYHEPRNEGPSAVVNAAIE